MIISITNFNNHFSSPLYMPPSPSYMHFFAIDVLIAHLSPFNLIDIVCMVLFQVIFKQLLVVFLFALQIIKF